MILPYLTYNPKDEEAHLIVVRPFLSAFPAFLTFITILSYWFDLDWQSNDTALLALEYTGYYVVIAVVILTLLYVYHQYAYSVQPSRGIATLKASPIKAAQKVKQSDKEEKELVDTITKAIQLWQEYDLLNEPQFWKNYDQLLHKVKKSKNQISHYR